MAKKSGKVAIAVVCTALLMAVAVGGIWWYMDTQLKAQQARATSLQNQLASQTAQVNPAFLEVTATNDFDFTAGIDANGGVAADDTANAAVDPTLDIVNMDTQDDATNVWITMWDPESSSGGMPVALQDTTMTIYVTWNGVLVPLYLANEGVGTYTNGVNIGTIPKGGSVTGITFSGIVDAAADDTYDDSGATYTLKIFVYQADALDSTPVSYTVST